MTIMNIVPVLSAEVHGDEISDLDEPLWHMFSRSADSRPNETAIVSLWQPHDHMLSENTANSKNLRWTYKQLLVTVEKLAAWLSQNGCSSNSRGIAVFLPNSVEWVLFFWAAIKLGVPFIPLDPRSKESAFQTLLDSTKPCVLVVEKGQESLCSGHEHIPIRIVCTQSGTLAEGDWLTLPEILSVEPNIIASDERKTIPREDPDTALIIFTSGTTSAPKGCCHTARNLWSESFNFDPVSGDESVYRYIVHTPVWHIFAVNQMLRAWRYGHTVIFPSKYFDVHASVQALIEEKCTHIAVVPTLAYAMGEHPSIASQTPTSLKYISIGGTMITEGDIKYCKTRLGGEHVIQGFGLSEGIPISSWYRNSPLLAGGHRAGVGEILPGVRARICLPKSQQPLNRGDVGELHIGGTSVIEKYLNNEQSGAFYKDQYGSWFITGDQASIDEDGILHIVGRYKDIIIRGGENVNPAEIERCLETFAGAKAQVIGVPDEIAGEVPIAVILFTKHVHPKNEMAKRVLQKLGKNYALEAMITTKELGIERFPMTSTGKVKKGDLKDLVEKYTAHRFPSDQNKTGDLITQLRSLWADLLFLELDELHPESDAFNFADSITTLKFCRRVSKTYNVNFRLADIRNQRTIQQQAEFISKAQLQTGKSDIVSSSRNAILDYNLLERGMLPGTAFSILKQPGHRLQFEFAGCSAIRGDVPIKTDSVFRWASGTKLVTSIAALQCIERGLITLDEPVCQYIPEIDNPVVISVSDTTNTPSDSFVYTPAKTKITLRHLLSHTSGIGYDEINPTLRAWRKARGEEYLSNTGNTFDQIKMPLLFEPGTGWNYGAGFHVVGLLIERLNNGMPLEEYTKRYIFDPLELTSSSYSLLSDPKLKSRLVELYDRTPLGGLEPRAWAGDNKGSAGGNSLYASVPDYMAILSDVISKKPQLLSRDSIDLLFQPQFEQGSNLLQDFKMKVPLVVNAFSSGLTETLADVNQSFAGLLTLDDSSLGRTKGTVFWAGVTGVYWFANREVGIAGALASQSFLLYDTILSDLIKGFVREAWKDV